MSDFNTFAASGISSPGFKSFLGDEITITHGGQTSAAITATVSRDQQLIDEVNGQLIEWRGVTFQIDAADLVINGVTLEPVSGMQVMLGAETFQVQPPPGNQQCFSKMAGGLRLVIYAVQIE